MAFDFFRKHQKLILYTAGIFALVTFSITGAVMGFFAPDAASFYKAPRMTLPGGRVVEVTYQDWLVGRTMLTVLGQPAVVLPNIATGEEGEQLAERFGAIRRLAIEAGVDASEAEVDRAIDQGLAVMAASGNQFESPTALARASGFSSLAEYRNVLGEAMRIGTYLRLMSLATDNSDATLVEELLEDSEQLTLRTAVLDKKALEEQVKAEEISDEDLQAWLDSLEDNERVPYQDTNHTSLAAIGLLYEGFDPAAFAAELGDKSWTDEELEQAYNQRRERFRRPEPETSPGGDGATTEGSGTEEPGTEEPGTEGSEEPGEGGEAGSTEGPGGPRDDGWPIQDPPTPEAPTPAAQPPEGQGAEPEAQPSEQPQGAPGAAEGPIGPQGPTAPATQDPESPYLPLEQVKEELQRMLQTEAVLDALRNGPVQEKLAAHVRSQVEARNAATREAALSRKALADAEAALAEDEDDDALKTAVDEAKAEVETKETAEKAAEEALDARRSEFDFVAEMQSLLGDRPGVVMHRIDTPTGSDGLRELGDLGSWTNTWMATSMSASGDLSTQVQSTDNACFHFQVPKVIVRPLRPFEDIAERARADYYAKQADEIAEEAKEGFTERLLELAKQKIPDELERIHKESDEALDKRYSEWEEQVKADLAEADAMIAKVPPRTAAHQSWQTERAALQAKLDGKDDQRAEFAKESEEELETSIEEAARKAYKDVLAEAVGEAPIEIKVLGPHLTNLSRRPRFRERHEGPVAFLWGDGTASPEVLELEEGESTGVLEDTAGRALYLAVCESRQPATLGDLTRREVVMARNDLARTRPMQALRQSFTIEALEKRYNYQLPSGSRDAGEPEAAAADGASSEEG
ncbi:MAG: hypothetical protein AAF628_08635 [Planctomycetota bacterium]